MSPLQHHEELQEESLQGDLDRLVSELADRSDPESKYLRARALHRLGRRKEALGLIREAHREFLEDPLIEGFLAFLEAAADRSMQGQSIERLRELVGQGQNAAPQVWLARLQYAQHNRDYAKDMVTALLEEHPNNGLVLETAALFRYGARDFLGALELLDRLPPGKGNAALEEVHLGALLYSGRLSDARDAYHRSGRDLRFAWLLSLWPYRAFLLIVLTALGFAAMVIPSWWLAALVSVVSILGGWSFGWHILQSRRSLIAGFVAAVTPWAVIIIRQAVE